MSGKEYTILSLFSGAGGLDLGFEAEGFKLLEAIDINPWCVKTIHQNRPNWKVILGDICTYEPNRKQSPDVLLAGVPCQGFSLGGNRESHDKRNFLYKEVIRIAEICRPRVILIENVLNLRTMLAPHTQIPYTEQIAAELTKIGYQVFYDIFKVCYYGVPQTRRRFVFIAFKKAAPSNYFLPQPETITTIRNFLYDLGQNPTIHLPNHNPNWGFKSAVHLETKEIFNSSEEVLPVRLSRTASDGHPVRSFDAPFPAIDTATVWGWAQGNITAKRYAKDRTQEKFVRNPQTNVTLWRISASRIRAFTHREYARLQTFPDDWVFEGKNNRDIHLQIGNAVPVNFAQHLAKNVKKALNCLDKNLPFSGSLSKTPISEYVQLSLF